jgi:hypothetical protein
VALGTVRAEQLPTEREVGVDEVELLLGRDRGAGGQRRHVGGEVRDLLLVELRVRLGGHLVGRRGRRHAAGADLEVDRSGADTDQRGAVLATLGGGDDLAVLAVARGAAHEEERASLGDRRLVGLARLGGGRREHGVEPPGRQQRQQQHDQAGQRAAALG